MLLTHSHVCTCSIHHTENASAQILEGKPLEGRGLHLVVSLVPKMAPGINCLYDKMKCKAVRIICTKSILPFEAALTRGCYAFMAEGNLDLYEYYIGT